MVVTGGVVGQGEMSNNTRLQIRRMNKSRNLIYHLKTMANNIVLYLGLLLKE